MAQASFAAMPTIGASQARPAPRLARTLHALSKTFKTMFDPYRPELHYMRGPGPKWREKHGQTGAGL